MKALALSALISLNAFAALPPGVDPARFDTFVKKVAFVGTPMDLGDMQFRVFSEVKPEEKEIPHKAEYFSAVGVKDSLGKFHTVELSVVSEDWRKRENNDWEIEQWIFQAETDGSLRSVAHRLLIETHEGRVLDLLSLPVGAPDSPEEQARWGVKTQEWLQRYP